MYIKKSMSLYNFDKYNKDHIGEDYILVWNDGRMRAYSFEAYFMKWDGHNHEAFADGYGEDERDALYNLSESIEFKLKELTKINSIVQQAFENCDKKSLLVN